MGDLPEGAVSTDDEEDPRANDEVVRSNMKSKTINKALDMDLDAPLGDGEGLYVAKHRTDVVTEKRADGKGTVGLRYIRYGSYSSSIHGEDEEGQEGEEEEREEGETCES